MSDTDANSCNETDKPPYHNKELLNKIWEIMQEEKIERERIRRKTEEKLETNRKEDKEGLNS
jgi:ribonuclease HI